MRAIKDIKLGEADELLALRNEEGYHSGLGGFTLGKWRLICTYKTRELGLVVSPCVPRGDSSSTLSEHCPVLYCGAAIRSFSQNQWSVLGQGWRGEPDRGYGPQK